MAIKVKDKAYEILNANGKTFLFDGAEVKKVTTKLVTSSLEELDEEVSKQKDQKTVSIDPKVFEILKKEFGVFEILV